MSPWACGITEALPLAICLFLNTDCSSAPYFFHVISQNKLKRCSEVVCMVKQAPATAALLVAQKLHYHQVVGTLRSCCDN